jgi:hypothetical protein
MSDTMNGLERDVMDAVLAGDDPRLSTLREQLSVAEVTGRDFTEAGFLTHFSAPEQAPRATGPIRTPIDDVCAELVGEQQPAGFLLWLEDGALQSLEGFSYIAKWPEDAQLQRLFYVRTEPGGGRIETPDRDLSEALEPAGEGPGPGGG